MVAASKKVAKKVLPVKKAVKPVVNKKKAVAVPAKPPKMSALAIQKKAQMLAQKIQAAQNSEGSPPTSSELVSVGSNETQ